MTKTARGTRESYSSPLINERRERILAEAQALIVQKGEAGFTIRELSQRAKVAQRTLYNAFGDKETIIARATEEHYSARYEDPTYWQKNVTARSILNYLDQSVVDILATREYARSMTAVYFSPRANEKVYLALKHVAARAVRMWAETAQQKGWVESWYPISTIGDRYANMFMSTIHDWLIGRIADEDLAMHAKQDFLVTIAGAVRARERAEVGRLLTGLTLRRDQRTKTAATAAAKSSATKPAKKSAQKRPRKS